jgi:predicted aldo/keto reductase-like oxidoreductase
MSELTKEEREKENLIDEIERALHALVNSSTDVCPLPMPTPEEIQSKKELCKIILDELNKADESKKK